MLRGRTRGGCQVTFDIGFLVTSWRQGFCRGLGFGNGQSRGGVYMCVRDDEEKRLGGREDWG